MKMSLVLGIIPVLLFTACKGVQCPIEDSPTIKINEHLLGTWVYPRGGGQKDLYIVTAKSDNEYQLTDITPGHVKNSMYCYISELNNYQFCNVYDGKDSILNYHLMRIVHTGYRFDNIKLVTVYSRKIKHLANPAAVRNYITSNINNPNLYKDTVELYKLTESATK